jgi:hypothetical protein
MLERAVPIPKLKAPNKIRAFLNGEPVVTTESHNMSGYTKLFQSIVTSSIWSEDDRTRIIWITMLALANQHGEVEASVPGLAKLASVPVEDVEAALRRLAAPDPYSRTKEFEGRRIEAIDGGWRVLNHAKYRAKASAEDRREQDRLRKQRVRGSPQASAPVRTESAPVTQCPPKQSQKQSQKQKQNQKTETETKTGGFANRPLSVQEVVALALIEANFPEAKVNSWVGSVDWSRPARALVAIDANASVREALELAFRFIRYNNLNGWKIRSWRKAFPCFSEECQTGSGPSDVPKDWVPAIELP